MTTVRQIQKMWAAKDVSRLVQHLLQPRAEGGRGDRPRLERDLSHPVAAAALAVVRLDEMSQSYVSLAGQLLQVVLTAQRPDGGWGDPMTTALCVRALITGRGHGQAVEDGIAALSRMQKDDGLWPNVAAHRMPGDPFTTAYILLQLGDHEPFRDAVNLVAAVDWFDRNDLTLDDDTRRLWTLTRRRCLSHKPTTLGGLWS